MAVAVMMEVTGTWHTRKPYDVFAMERTGPSTAGAGFPQPPTVRRLDVHNSFSPGANA